jgi:hypothetical protein
MTTWIDFRGPTFTLEIPSHWYITATPQVQTLLLGPEDDSGVRPSFSISMRPVQEQVTAAAVAQETRETQEASYPEYDIIAEEDFTDETNAGYIRRYRWHNEERDLDVHQVQAFLVIEGILYTLTGTRPAIISSDIDDSLTRMIDTFRVLSEQPPTEAG